MLILDQGKSYGHTGKTTMIRRTAVRETRVSRQHGGPIEGPPEISPIIIALSYWGV